MMLRCFLLILLLLTCFTLTFAQESDSDTRVVYVKQLVSDDFDIVTITGTMTAHLQVNGGDCYEISPDLKHAAVIRRDNETPLALQIYELANAKIVWDIPWNEEWTQLCSFFWHDSQFLKILDHIDTSDPDYWTYYDFTIDITDGSISELSVYTPIAPELPDVMDYYYIESPDGDKVVYVKCDDQVYTGTDGELRCTRPTEAVIYSLKDQRVIVILHRAATINFGYREFSSQMSWSPSGRYLAYISSIRDHQWQIYDTGTETYLDVSNTDTSNMFISPFSDGAIWAPDETQFSFWVSILDPDSQLKAKLATYNIHTQSIKFFPTFGLSRQVVWMPGERSVAIHLYDNRLVHLVLDGTDTEILIDENVISVFTNVAGGR